MRTSTHVAAWRSAVPLASFAARAPALPMVSFAFNRIRQFGDGSLGNSLFDSASQVPDQITTSQVLGAEWQPGTARLTYEWDRSLQDNRQPGRESADFETVKHTFGVGVMSTAALDLGAEVAFEGIDALEQAHTRFDAAIRHHRYMASGSYNRPRGDD
jgi:hypothetical protein